MANSNTVKACVVCARTLPIVGNFYPSGTYKGKQQFKNKCKQCSNVARRLWYHQGPGRAYYVGYRKRFPHKLLAATRRYHLRQFGLDDASYGALLANQRFACALCGRPSTLFKKKFSVDHDHKTGKVRALLCSSCNTGLGLFQDSPARLRRAARYLELHSRS